ncbi:MAG: DUF1294 domain-containing protein [Clostridiales bacterium]|nr:DUF1294 domain-containing protein [Clostridiales bacterium]
MLIAYLIVINVTAVIITVFDKLRAVHGGWRVRERSLIIVSALGGSAGMYLTMLLIRHKTRRIKFMLGIPLIFIIQCVLFYFLRRIIYGQ